MNISSCPTCGATWSLRYCCKGCDATFYAGRLAQRYCTPACRARAKSRRAYRRKKGDA